MKYLLFALAIIVITALFLVLVRIFILFSGALSTRYMKRKEALDTDKKGKEEQDKE